MPEQAVALAGGSSGPRATNSSIREESHGMAPEAGYSIFLNCSQNIFAN